MERIFDSPFSSENFQFFIKDDENWEEVCKISATVGDGERNCWIDIKKDSTPRTKTLFIAVALAQLL